jgi:hypothetical protein
MNDLVDKKAELLAKATAAIGDCDRAAASVGEIKHRIEREPSLAEAKPMDVDFMFGIATQTFKRHHGLPHRTGDLGSGPPDADVIAEVFRAGQLFAKVWRERASSELVIIRLVEPDPGNQNFWSVRDRDAARARRYFTGWMERDFGIAANCL